MPKIKFHKMVSAGNDFIIVDNRRGRIKDVRRFTQRVCHPHYGIGADGVLLVERSQKANFRMRIINADGSEAEMCGNGTRSAALYAYRVLGAPKHLRWETKGGQILTWLRGSKVKSQLASPKDFRSRSTLNVNGTAYDYYFVNTGVPHAVLFTKNLKRIPVTEVGQAIRHHRRFAPKGTNVNFVQIRSRTSLEIRTYERGVEGETLACGTGVAASAIISGVQGFCRSPIRVKTRSGERLVVSFKQSRFKVDHVVVEGPARFICEGNLYV